MTAPANVTPEGNAGPQPREPRVPVADPPTVRRCGRGHQRQQARVVVPLAPPGGPSRCRGVDRDREVCLLATAQASHEIGQQRCPVPRRGGCAAYKLTVRTCAPLPAAAQAEPARSRGGRRLASARGCAAGSGLGGSQPPCPADPRSDRGGQSPPSGVPWWWRGCHAGLEYRRRAGASGRASPRVREVGQKDEVGAHRHPDQLDGRDRLADVVVLTAERARHLVTSP